MRRGSAPRRRGRRGAATARTGPERDDRRRAPKALRAARSPCPSPYEFLRICSSVRILSDQEDAMRYRLLGPSGLRVSEAALGTMTFGETWGWGASREECGRMLATFA